MSIYGESERVAHLFSIDTMGITYDFFTHTPAPTLRTHTHESVAS
jgi:hypothetical protein